MFAARDLLLTGSRPPITFDAVGAGNHTTTAVVASLSYSHTITGNAVLAMVATFLASQTTMTAKVGATSMTLLSSLPAYASLSGPLSLYVFGLLNPPTGAQTITFTPSTSNWMACNSVSYKNVGSFGTAATNTGTGASGSLSVTSVTGKMVAQVFSGTYNNVLSAYTQTSRSSITNNSQGCPTLQVGDAPGAPSVSFGVTVASGQLSWAAIGIPLT